MDRGRILSDATSEHQRVQSAQRRRECTDPLPDRAAKQRGRFSRLHVPRFTVEQVTHVRKPLLMFPSIGMLLGSRFIDPVSLAIVMSMQSRLVIPS